MTHLLRRFWTWLLALFFPSAPALPDEPLDPLAWTVTFWTAEDIAAVQPGLVIGPTQEDEPLIWLRIGRVLSREPRRWKDARVVMSGPGFPTRPLNRNEKRAAIAFARRVAP